MSYEIQPAHHNQQPTHQLGLAKNDQNCQFWVKVGPINGKILCFTRESKSFCTHITEKHLSNLSALFFGQAQDKMGQKCQYLANNNQKCIFWTKFCLLGPKILILTGESKSFGSHVTEKPPRHLVRIVFWSGIGSNGPKMPIFGQESQFWAKFGRLWAKNPNFYGSK